MDQAVADGPVILVIRAPNQKYDDQTINCCHNWTVEKLKAHLSDVYPSKPVSITTRIVWGFFFQEEKLREHTVEQDMSTVRRSEFYSLVC